MESYTTCWTMIEGAAQGEPEARVAFAREYEPLVRRYLARRWRGRNLLQELGDALQEVFIECYREGGALARVDRERGSSFRAFLFGVTRNVARRFEGARQGSSGDQEQDVEAIADDPSLSVLFDRQWALKIMAEAARQQRQNAQQQGAEALRRVALLELRFTDSLSIREIASRWNEDPQQVHRQYARARVEFRRALFEVLARYQQGEPRDLEKECGLLLSLLS